MTIEVPVKPHVRQYLLVNNYLKGEQLVINEKDPAALFLLNAIEPKRNITRKRGSGSGAFGRKYKPNGRTVLEVCLGTDKRYNYKMWVPKHKLRWFNSFIDEMIRKEFMKYVDDFKDKSDDAKVDRLIKEFEAKYKLGDTGLSFQTLKRWYYRKKENSENKAA